MVQQAFDINNLRIASPCPISWDEMTGDDRSRHCDLCELNVHNVAGMTRQDVARLVSQSDGRLCMRLVRRADGTVMTKDCPVGLRAYRKRVSGLAAAAFTSVLSLFSVSYGQDSTNVDPAKIQITRSADLTGKARIMGVVTDPNGAVIPNMKILLLQEENDDSGNRSKKKRNDRLPVAETTSDNDGNYLFDGIVPGTYQLRVLKKGGFAEYHQTNIQLLADRVNQVNVVISPKNIEVELLGVVGDPIGIDMTSNERKTVFTREMLDRMPGGRPF